MLCSGAYGRFGSDVAPPGAPRRTREKNVSREMQRMMGASWGGRAGILAARGSTKGVGDEKGSVFMLWRK